MLFDPGISRAIALWITRPAQLHPPCVMVPSSYHLPASSCCGSGPKQTLWAKTMHHAHQTQPCGIHNNKYAGAFLGVHKQGKLGKTKGHAMLYALSHLSNIWSAFNLFHYITVRSMIALVLAFAASLWGMPKFIPWIKTFGTQPIRDDGPATHLITKQGRATMGGIVILGSWLISVLICGNLTQSTVWILMGITLGFGVIGAWDDGLKIMHRKNKGLSEGQKILGQVLIAGLGLGALAFCNPETIMRPLTLPVFKDATLHLGPVLMMVFAMLLMIGASNAVNLTDGLDGLAIGPVLVTTAVLGVWAYAVGHMVFAKHFLITYVPQAAEVTVLCGALAGSSLGFLWYNAHPASIMMGDVGALALGGFLGSVAFIIRQEYVLAIAGSVMVAETLSVIAQVIFFKSTKGRRLFLMAPLHHHFEKKGWSENTIVIRWWIVSILTGLLALSLLKVR
jgi:phospho-N-acetylmuramoyl-pentapeptide-transferase